MRSNPRIIDVRDGRMLFNGLPACTISYWGKYRGEDTAAQTTALRNTAQAKVALMNAREAAETNAQLQGVDARVQVGDAGVRNVHESEFRAPIVFALRYMEAQGPAGSEIDVRRTRWDFDVREQRAAAQFEIRNNFSEPGEIPFQSEGVQAHAKRRVRFLGNDKSRHGV